MRFTLSRLFRRNRLTDPQQAVLAALLEGWTLKSHRTLDGQKAYRLHGLNGEIIDVADGVVDGLAAAKLLQSNQKFPAATYLLTQKGHSLATRFRESAKE
ncbi:MAG: hypothetical protein KF753_17640 [Caldilineaceae bacterium]|nr:hypothetical protein [Caldilineaceae bacterium]